MNKIALTLNQLDALAETADRYPCDEMKEATRAVKERALSMGIEIPDDSAEFFCV